jgi:hypothetical protein
VWGASNEGTEFWAVDLDTDTLVPYFGIAVTNPSTSQQAIVRLVDASGVLDSAVVGPGTTAVFSRERDHSIGGTDVRRAAYQVLSDVPVVATQFSPHDDTGTPDSYGSSLLLPASLLATEHMVLSWPAAVPENPSLFAVVAVQPGVTRVSVIPSATTLAGGPVQSLRAGERFEYEMEQFEVMQIEAGEDQDLIGSLVFSTRPVAVFAGGRSTQITKGVCCFDHIEEQLIPVTCLGTHYMASRSPIRNDLLITEPDVFRVIALEDGTTLTTDPRRPSMPVMLDRGQHYEMSADEDFLIEADKPIAAAQFLIGMEHYFVDTGDPAEIQLIPIDQYRRDHIVYVPPNASMEHHLTLVAPEGSSVSIDGSPVPAGEFTAVGTSGYAVARVSIEAGTHAILGEEPIGAYLLAYGTWRAYGHPVGLNLDPINVTVVCDAGGPYESPCDGRTTEVTMDGTASFDPGGAAVSFVWEALDAGLSLSDAGDPRPVATVDGLGVFRVRLTVSDGGSEKSCETTVSITGEATPPVEVSPPPSGMPLRIQAEGNELRLSFSDLGSGQAGYDVYEGELGIYYTHTAAGCAVPVTPDTPGRLAAEITPSTGSRYYLVTAHTCLEEGPSGFDSHGIERDPGRNSCGD